MKLIMLFLGIMALGMCIVLAARQCNRTFYLPNEYTAWCKAFNSTNLTMHEWTLLRERRLLPTSVNK